MTPNWSVQKEILKRVQKEDNEMWAKNTETIPLPPFQEVKVEKKRKAWGLLLALRP